MRNIPKLADFLKKHPEFIIVDDAGKMWAQTDRIARNIDQPRKEFKKESLERLGESINSSEQEQAIKIFLLNDEKEESWVLERLPDHNPGNPLPLAMIIDGQRRHMTSEKRGRIWVTIDENVKTLKDLDLKALVCNHGRENHTINEMIDWVVRLTTMHKMKPAEVAETLATKVTDVLKYIQLSKLHPELRLFLDRNKARELGRDHLTIGAALQIVKEIPREDQVQYYQEIGKSLTGKEISRTLGKKRFSDSSRFNPKDSRRVVRAALKKCSEEFRHILDDLPQEHIQGMVFQETPDDHFAHRLNHLFLSVAELMIRMQKGFLETEKGEEAATRYEREARARFGVEKWAPYVPPSKPKTSE